MLGYIFCLLFEEKVEEQAEALMTVRVSAPEEGELSTQASTVTNLVAGGFQGEAQTMR
jgi:hypothetical protein